MLRHPNSLLTVHQIFSGNAFLEHVHKLTLRLPFGFIVNRPEPAGLVVTGAGAHVPCCQLSQRTLPPGHETIFRSSGASYPWRAAADRTCPGSSVQILKVRDQFLKTLLISEQV